MDLAVKFGGGKSLHADIFSKLIDRLVFYFARFIKIPTKAEAKYHEQVLRMYVIYNTISISF